MIPRTAVLVGCAVVMLGCGIANDSSERTPTPTLRLIPTQTEFSAAIATAVSTESAEAPALTPTPFFHIVREGETLLGIALQYALELDEVLAANPEINPRFLSVGQEVEIPILEDGTGLIGLPTATPIPLSISDGMCYDAIGEGSWCLISVTNTQDRSVENVTVQFEYHVQDTEEIKSQTLFPPLNLLPPGLSMPYTLRIEEATHEVELLPPRIVSAIPGSADSERYFLVKILEVEESFSADLRSVDIEGQLEIERAELPLGSIAGLVAVAFDENNEIVGFTKFETSAIGDNSSDQFAIRLVSFGPSIASVSLFAEGLALP